jgi:hypothetical protein
MLEIEVVVAEETTLSASSELVSSLDSVRRGHQSDHHFFVSSCAEWRRNESQNEGRSS